MANLALLIKQISEGILRNEELYSQVCTVTKIDDKKRTCTVQPLDDSAEIFGVKMQAFEGGIVGLFIKPKLNTAVIVTFINNNAGFISMVSEIEEILINCESVVFNNGDNGGLINIEKLITESDRDTKAIGELQEVFNTWVPVLNDGGASLKTLLTQFISLPLADLSNIEDKKVKH